MSIKYIKFYLYRLLHTSYLPSEECLITVVIENLKKMKKDKPSSTALLIAKAQVFLANNERTEQFIPEKSKEASLWFVEECGERDYDKKSRNGLYRVLLKCIERIAMPGILLHYSLRKRFIENEVRAAIKSGAEQVVILAAGFDTLAFRLHNEFKNVKFFELDHPATQYPKKSALDKRNLPGDNFVMIPIDFSRETIENVLQNGGFLKDKKSVFVAEGITMYLTEDEVNKLFSSVSGLCVSGSFFIFTHMEKNDNKSDISAKLTDIWLWMKRETYKWSVARDKVADFASRHGFGLQKDISYKQLQADYANERTKRLISNVRGENLCSSIKI